MCKTPTGTGTDECHWLWVSESVTRIGDGRRQSDVHNDPSHQQLVTSGPGQPKTRPQTVQGWT